MDLKEADDQDLRARLEQLPTLPAVVARLMSLKRDADDYFEQVHDLLREDPPFAVKMLHVANSAMYAPISPITTLPAALARLGANRIAELVTSAAVTRVFVPSTTGQRNLWIHSVQVATAARRIAAESLDQMAEPEEAYLAGLLHDIGRFIMFLDDPQEQVDIDAEHWTSPAELLETEHRICGWDHAELGRRICAAWDLPERLALIIREHHATDLDGRVDIAPDQRRVIQSVQMADALSMLMLLDPSWPDLEPDARLERIEQRCIDPEWHEPPISPPRLVGLLDAIEEESRTMSDALGLAG